MYFNTSGQQALQHRLGQSCGLVCTPFLYAFVPSVSKIKNHRLGQVEALGCFQGRNREENPNTSVAVVS